MNPDEQVYLQQSAKSFTYQGNTLTVPVDQLGGIVEIPLGFQPMGITSTPLSGGGGDQVAIAAYYEPAVCIADVKKDDLGLHFTVDWMRGALNGITSCRGGFPDIPTHVGANRCYLAFRDPRDQSLWVGRGDRDFFVLVPPTQHGTRWTLVRRVSLPLRQGQAVSSAVMLPDGSLSTIETSGDLEQWESCYYTRSGEGFALQRVTGTRKWHYGVDFLRGELLTVADFRAEEAGVFLGDRCLVKDVNGSGICLLSDGSMLVARYGQSHSNPFNGIPGALVYIPREIF